MNSHRPSRRILAVLLAAGVATALPLHAQPKQRPAEERPRPLSFEEYNPVSMLKVPGQEITRAKFPFIDVHNHQRRHSPTSLADVVREMDAMNMAIMVNLSGGYGQSLRDQVALNERVAPGRLGESST